MPSPCASLAPLVAVGVEVADDVVGLLGDFEEVLLLGDLFVLAVAVLDPLLPLLLLTLHRQHALALDLQSRDSFCFRTPTIQLMDNIFCRLLFGMFHTLLGSS